MTKKIELCSIYNIKNALCSEDCVFCAQSTHSQHNLDSYGISYSKTAVDEAVCNHSKGVNRFSFVASGRYASNKEIDILCKMYADIGKRCNIKLCASLGLLPFESMLSLKAAGVSRYHCNLETSRRFFPNICSTHSYDDKIKTLYNAKIAGLSTCSGLLIGMGEDFTDRLSLAEDLHSLDVDSVPVNILIPMKGTPLEKAVPLTYEEIRETFLALSDILGSEKLRIAGGRMFLKDFGLEIMTNWVGAAITGDMLTTEGNRIEKDIEMIENAGMEVAAYE